MDPVFAYLAAGKLHWKEGDRPAVPLESKFGESVRQRAVELHRRHAWKAEGRGAQFMRGGMLWAGADRDPSEMRIAITGVTAGEQSGELFYTLDTPDISGLFLLRNGGSDELRIYHTADFRLAEVAAHPESRRLALVLRDKAGSSSLAVMSFDGGQFTEVTQGDSMYAAPQWLPGERGQLVFQSAGIARDDSGSYNGRGPFSIQRLDLESGEMTALAEDAAFDFLCPHVAGDGTLYCIRRPYEPPHPRIKPLRMLLDVLLFPFRLLYAVFQFFNFFTMKYTGNPLLTAGNARQRTPDLRQMMIWGNLVNATESQKQRPGEEPPDLVPKNWELVRFAAQSAGNCETLARGVLSFDLAGDGALVYSNGTAVFRWDGSGRTGPLVKDSLIHMVAAVRR